VFATAASMDRLIQPRDAVRIHMDENQSMSEALRLFSLVNEAIPFGNWLQVTSCRFSRLFGLPRSFGNLRRSKERGVMPVNKRTSNTAFANHTISDLCIRSHARSCPNSCKSALACARVTNGRIVLTPPKHLDASLCLQFLNAWGSLSFLSRKLADSFSY
jgi:hypothetical protein